MAGLQRYAIVALEVSTFVYLDQKRSSPETSYEPSCINIEYHWVRIDLEHSLVAGTQPVAHIKLKCLTP